MRDVYVFFSGPSSHTDSCTVVYYAAAPHTHTHLHPSHTAMNGRIAAMLINLQRDRQAATVEPLSVCGQTRP